MTRASGVGMVGSMGVLLERSEAACRLGDSLDPSQATSSNKDFGEDGVRDVVNGILSDDAALRFLAGRLLLLIEELDDTGIIGMRWMF